MATTLEKTEQKQVQSPVNSNFKLKPLVATQDQSAQKSEEKKEKSPKRAQKSSNLLANLSQTITDF